MDDQRRERRRGALIFSSGRGSEGTNTHTHTYTCGDGGEDDRSVSSMGSGLFSARLSLYGRATRRRRRRRKGKEEREARQRTRRSTPPNRPHTLTHTHTHKHLYTIHCSEKCWEGNCPPHQAPAEAPTGRMNLPLRLCL